MSSGHVRRQGLRHSTVIINCVETLNTLVSSAFPQGRKMGIVKCRDTSLEIPVCREVISSQSCHKWALKPASTKHFEVFFHWSKKSPKWDEPKLKRGADLPGRWNDQPCQTCLYKHRQSKTANDIYRKSRQRSFPTSSSVQRKFRHFGGSAIAHAPL
jgi:hypothetical protein